MGTVHVYDDGQAGIHRHRARPDRPAYVLVKGVVPNDAQLKTLALIWKVLSQHFSFSVMGLCPVLQFTTETKSPEVLPTRWR